MGNAGRNWKAQVRETIDATLNRVSSSGVQGASYFAGSVNSIMRDSVGSYLAVSARGNFYLTFTPGDEFWVPHNRVTSRRTIFGSKDGGATWQKDKSADDLPTNLYKIKFFGKTGYILGSNGVLLRIEQAV